MTFKGHSRSSGMLLFDTAHMISYYRFPVTVALYCIVSHIYCSQILVENREIYIPHLYSTPPQGWPRQNFANLFSTGKTRMMGMMLRKVCTGAWQTDGRTELLYQYRLSVSALLSWHAIKQFGDQVSTSNPLRRACSVPRDPLPPAGGEGACCPDAQFFLTVKHL